MQTIEQDNQTLFPFEYDGELYYVRFVRRGTRVDCSGVFKIEFAGDRIEPLFTYQNMDKSKIRRLILTAKQRFLSKI